MTQSDVMIEASLRRQQYVDSVIISSVFDKLTDELLIETLIRLPLKSANLCKCISVRFRSLISTPYFVRCYLNHHKIKTTFALYYEPDNPIPIRSNPVGIDIAFDFPIFESPGFSLSFLGQQKQKDLNYLVSNYGLKYLASNNGLVLCCAGLSCEGLSPVVYFVCNPLTKQWIALPPPPSNSETPYVGFICNPQYSCSVDHEQGRTTNFKVIRIVVKKGKFHTSVSRKLELEVFCSVSGRWTKDYYTSSSTSDHELFYTWTDNYPGAVVCDGLLHWYTLPKRGIFTYDPCNGKCRTMELPREIRNPTFPFIYSLGESAGRLRYSILSMSDKNYQVWELKDYKINGGGEWLLLHKVHLDEMKSTSTVQTVNMNLMFPLPPHPLNQDIVFFWCGFSRRILEYNMRDKLLKLPCFLRDAKITSRTSTKFFPFVLPGWPTTIPLIPQHGPSY